MLNFFLKKFLKLYFEFLYSIRSSPSKNNEIRNFKFYVRYSKT